MEYIVSIGKDGDVYDSFRDEYNTENFTIDELVEICKNWNDRNDNGIRYELRVSDGKPEFTKERLIQIIRDCIYYVLLWGSEPKTIKNILNHMCDCTDEDIEALGLGFLFGGDDKQN